MNFVGVMMKCSLFFVEFLMYYLNMTEFDKGDYADKFSDYYIYIATLGSGSFGKVVHALDRQSGLEVAVKIITKKTVKPGKILELKKEAEILSALDHPNIVKFIHLKETEKRLFLVMELVYGGNLSQFMQSTKLTDTQSAQIMHGVLKAVEYMHNKNVIHRDIKPQNILVSSKKNLTMVKLADFGLSSEFDSHSMENEKCGTLWFMAPEQTGKTFYSQSVDIWSCGILMYLLITGKHPLGNSKETRAAYLKKLKSPKWKIPEYFSPAAKNLFLKLVEVVPIERYTATQALAHPWILRREGKPPLTSFEKVKIYGELLSLKNVVFPLFFIGIIAGGQNFIVESRTEESRIGKINPGPVLKPNNLIQAKRAIVNSTPDVSLLKRPNRFLTPGKSTLLSKKNQAKDLSGWKYSYLRKKV